MLKRRIAWLLGCLLGFAGALAAPARGQVWDFLGDKQIDDTRDHDRIRVTRRNGAFHIIQLRVSGEAIFLDRIVVHFGDGTSEELVVQGRIWPGRGNHIIGLSGENRVVDSVELWYYKEAWQHNPRVTLYGS
jgi:hypothetical protein